MSMVITAALFFILGLYFGNADAKRRLNEELDKVYEEFENELPALLKRQAD